jgi:methionyl-tRNA formyltransferase
VKIIFAGTPHFAAHALEALRQEHQIVAVLTQPLEMAKNLGGE